MSFRKRLILWRRRWCSRRGHPRAAWAPLVLWDKEPDRYDPETNTFIEGVETRTYAYRCARHDEYQRSPLR